MSAAFNVGFLMASVLVLPELSERKKGGARDDPGASGIFAGSQRPTWKSTFPPRRLVESGSDGAVARWFHDSLPGIAPPPHMTERERNLARMSASDYMEARRAGSVTCAEYAGVLVARAKHYAYMNHFMYWDNMPEQMDIVLREAEALDQRASADGIEAIAPLYGLPVPAKGTMATIDFPSSAGVGLLHDHFAVADAAALARLKRMNGIIFGKTNVPEFAGSWVSCNYANGCTLNPYNHSLTSGGSSGGSASAVASYVAPLAFTEDTAGSTRNPSVQNQNFGYDPSRNHYPNTGNPGISYMLDQVGLNARSFHDILAFDSAFLDTAAAHAAAAASARPAHSLSVGLPKYPFVEFYAPEGRPYSRGFAGKQKVSVNILQKYELVAAVLQKADVRLVEQEWSERNGRNAVDDLFHFSRVNGKPFEAFSAMVSTYTGQLSEWIRAYLNASVAVKDIMDDIFKAGEGHDPAGIMSLSNSSDESHFRYSLGPFVEKTLSVWNSYFDEYGVDVLLTPPQFCDAQTFECQAAGSCTLQRDLGNGYQPAAAQIAHCNMVSFFLFKNIPVPKVTVPVGLDAEGRPVSVEFWGRAGPKPQAGGRIGLEWLYDDDFAKTSDLDFLYVVRELVQTIHQEPSLRRQDARLVTGPGNLFA